MKKAIETTKQAPRQATRTVSVQESIMLKVSENTEKII